MRFVFTFAYACVALAFVVLVVVDVVVVGFLCFSVILSRVFFFWFVCVFFLLFLRFCGIL